MVIDFTNDGVVESRIEEDEPGYLRIVEVTDEHIGEGKEGSCSRCPIALAVDDMLRKDPLVWMAGVKNWSVAVQTSGVTVSNLDIPHGPFLAHATLPEEGKIFVDEYDDGLWTNQKLAWKSGDSEGLNGSFELELDFSPTKTGGRPRLGRDPSEFIRVRVPGEIKRRWRRMCAQRNRTESSVLREMLDDYLRHYKTEGARAAWVPQRIPHSPTRGG